MGKPAARVGDMTSHGGTVVTGIPTVLIGGMPAARIGDMHVCPMVNPGPVPHVGGPISLGSSGVFIGGMPAARVGDMAVCTGPPDTIAMGCFTVLIGEVAPGGGGGGGALGGGGGARTVSQLLQAAAAGTLVLAQRQVVGAAGTAGGQTAAGHWLDVEFVDKAGFPVTGAGYTLKGPNGRTRQGPLMGRIKLTGIEAGSYEIDLHAITKARWSTAKAKVGQKVKLIADTVGFASGQKATFEVMVRDSNFADQSLARIPAEVKADRIEGEWELLVDEAFLKIQEKKILIGRYSAPKYCFIVKVAGLSLRSNLLEYRDDFEIKVREEGGGPIARKKYRVIQPSGEVRQGTLDGSGTATERDVYPGQVKFKVDLRNPKFPS